VKNQDKMNRSEGYHLAKTLIMEAKTQTALYEAAKRADKISKEYHLDYIQIEQLENIGMQCYEKLARDGIHLMKNQKINW